MKITVLTENACHKNGCLAERGLSLLIEYKGKKILFDSGKSDIFLKNAEFLGVSLDDVDQVIFSHHHADHVRGLLSSGFAKGKNIMIHPDGLVSMKEKEELFDESTYNMQTSREPIEYFPGMWYLGEIGISNDFENIMHRGSRVFDDSAIAFDTEKGIVLLTGCSHSGIVNICEYAKQVLGNDLYMVMGGFHLFSEKEVQIKKTIEYFKDEKIPQLCPMHCVDFETQALMHKELGTTRYAAGNEIEVV